MKPSLLILFTGMKWLFLEGMLAVGLFFVLSKIDKHVGWEAVGDAIVAIAAAIGFLSGAYFLGEGMLDWEKQQRPED